MNREALEAERTKLQGFVSEASQAAMEHAQALRTIEDSGRDPNLTGDTARYHQSMHVVFASTVQTVLLRGILIELQYANDRSKVGGA